MEYDWGCVGLDHEIIVFKSRIEVRTASISKTWLVTELNDRVLKLEDQQILVRSNPLPLVEINLRYNFAAY